MNERRDEDQQHSLQSTLQMPPEIDKRLQELEIKIKDQISRLNEADKAFNEEIERAQLIIAIQDESIEMVQESAIFTTAIIYFICSVLIIFIKQLQILGWLITWLPYMFEITGSIMLLIMLIVEFCPKFISEFPINLLIFIIYSSCKILCFCTVSLKYDNYQIEIIMITLGICMIYLLQVVKNKITKKEDLLRIKTQWFNVIIMSLIQAGLLCLITKSKLETIIILFFIGIFYIYYSQLALQRFEQNEFLFENNNDIYLGTAQLDGDIIFMCKLVVFHCFQKKRTNNQQIEEEQIIDKIQEQL